MENNMKVSQYFMMPQPGGRSHIVCLAVYYLPALLVRPVPVIGVGESPLFRRRAHGFNPPQSKKALRVEMLTDLSAYAKKSLNGTSSVMSHPDTRNNAKSP